MERAVIHSMGLEPGSAHLHLPSMATPLRDRSGRNAESALVARPRRSPACGSEGCKVSLSRLAASLGVARTLVIWVHAHRGAPSHDAKLRSGRPSVRTLKYPTESVFCAQHRKGAAPIRNEVAADVYLELLPPASVAAELGLGSTRREPAMELLEPGTTV
jgi:hypothetical protein